MNQTASGTMIAVVDDDDLFRESISANLQDADFDVVPCGSGQELLDALAAGTKPDIILLDWKMPGMNGIDVLHKLRADQVDIPVIFLTVLGEQIYEEAALTGGAVDFVEKSRSFSIVLKRIRMILAGRKSAPATGEAATGGEAAANGEGHGHLTLNERSKRALWREKPVDLTLTEYNVVVRLVQNAGEDVSYRELYDQVHGRNFLAGEGETGVRANVRALIKRIRAKFKAVDPDFDQIANYPSFGYRWDV